MVDSSAASPSSAAPLSTAPADASAAPDGAAAAAVASAAGDVPSELQGVVGSAGHRISDLALRLLFCFARRAACRLM